MTPLVLAVLLFSAPPQGLSVRPQAALIPARKALWVVTFASQPGEIFVPVREAARALGMPMQFDPDVELIQLNGKVLSPERFQLSDGTWLVSLGELTQLGAKAEGNSIAFSGRRLETEVGPKRVTVDLKNQTLDAWQGGLHVYHWKVSTGREGKETPNGQFKAGEKEPMHISKLYGSPMPFSVHVTGNIYIHGSAAWSAEPGSHGCIRLPMIKRRNIAEEFYKWIDVGTPIRVTGAYEFRRRQA